MTDNSAAFHPQSDDVFARIAKDYDRYCDWFSLYIQRIWKRAFARQIIVENGDIWLDLASGTGDIPARVLKNKRHIEVACTDICQPMLDVARNKLSRYSTVSYARIDACRMPEVANDSQGLITMAFGMKIIPRDSAMREIYRCLKPGGVFLCIEASTIPLPWLHRLYLVYMNICLPIMGRLIAAGDASTYDYLLRGIHDFPDADAFSTELTAQGFTDISYQRLSLGIVAIHRAAKAPTQINVTASSRQSL